MSARARSPEQKALVRDALIGAGRRLLAQDPSSVSLRRIASEAGYSPGTVYQYFSDQEELFAYIRTREVEEATLALRALVAGESNPRKRLVGLLVGTATYWLDHMSDFVLVIPAPSLSPPDQTTATVPFGRSAAVLGMLAVYEEAVRTFFDTLRAPPVSVKVASDALLATVLGLIAIPHMARTVAWTPVPLMVEAVVEAVTAQWASAADVT